MVEMHDVDFQSEWRLHWTAISENMAAPASQRSCIVGATLEKLNLPRHHWLKEVEQAPEKSTVRRMKDRYFRELGQVHTDLQSLFGEEEQRAIKERTQEERDLLTTVQEQRELNNEAL
eukprot:Skav210638  [mRNA]  locus=scaffold1063:170640:172680:- [translate_table: standard]